METDKILRRTPTAMRPILQVVLERVDELEAKVAELEERLNTPAPTPKPKKAPKPKEPKEAEPEAEEPQAEEPKVEEPEAEAS